MSPEGYAGMPHDNRAIIAEPAGRRFALGVFVTALAIGAGAALWYARADLTLSHYDARAHLVVARRIVDSLTPGWKQIGAVWLPLPHLLNMPVVQWDWAYRTGYPSTAVSVLAMSIGLGLLSSLLLRRTQSIAAAAAAPAVILLNPNVLYLQSTPMTEPLLIGLSLVAIYLADRWIERGDGASLTRAGVAIAALALTRYEGWFVAGALVAMAAWGRRRDGMAALALIPWLGAAIAGFLLLSWGATGVWFVTSGFFNPEPETLGQLVPAAAHVARGAHHLSGTTVIGGGLVGLTAAVIALGRGRVGAALPLVLATAALLPLYAFYEGHPFRIRYMVPVVVACGALSALAIASLPRRLQWLAAALLVGTALWQAPPLDARAPMVVEAQWEAPYRIAREAVTQHLVEEWDGSPILASMGSLGHYMQESSHAGFALADFVHEGNGTLWSTIRERPGRYVNWMLIEGRAEGGDLFAERARVDPSLLDGLSLVAEGGGVALYRRVERDIVLPSGSVGVRSGPESRR